MESVKILLAVLIIIAVFMANYFYGIWITRRSKKVNNTTDPIQ